MKSSMVLKALAILISMGSPGIAQVDQWTRFDRLNDGAITCMTAAPNGDIYISTNQSGVHRSTDLGVTWQAVNNGINGTDVRVVAAAPNGDLYAAVCPDVAFSSSDYRAHGPFYVSTDQGGHWDSLSYVQVPQAILVTGSGDVVLGNEGGRYVGGIDCSTDGGRTWSTRSPGGTGSTYGMITTVIGYDSSNALYVAYRGGENTGIAKTTDRGATWTWNKLFGNLWGGTYFAWTAMTVLPDGTVLAAGDAGRAGLFRISSDGTSVISLDSSWCPNALAALPDGSIIASDSANMYRSTDQGITWVTTAPIAKPTTTSFVRHHSGRLFVGGYGQEGYLYQSTDGGLSWAAPRPFIKNTFVPSLLVLQSNTVLAGGRGTIYENQSDPDEWNLLAAEYGFHSYYRNYASTTWALYRDPGNRLLAGIGMVTSSTSALPPDRGRILESTDMGQTWQEMTSWSLSPTIGRPAPYCFTTSKTNTAIAGTSMGLFVLSESRIWTLKSNAPSTPVVGLLTTPDGTVYAATRGQGVYLSTDNGDSWFAHNQGLANLDGYTMTLDSAGSVCLGTARGAYRLKAPGASWEKLGPGLPDIPIQTALTLPNGEICFGTTDGVYRLMDTYWEHSLLSTDVTSLAVKGDRQILAGTWGAGVFHRTLPAIPTLTRPKNWATGQPVALNLSWLPVSHGSRYHLQIATSYGFDSSLVVSDSTITDTSTTVHGLAYNTQYYWRVRGFTVAGPGGFSLVSGFKTAQSRPSQPILATPLNNLSLTSNTVCFIWNRSTPDVTCYWHELATDSTFFIMTTDSTITDTTYLKTGIPNGTYWWRVRAINSTGWGAFSDARTFSVTVTGIDDPNDIPTIYSLDQNYPNPFNPTTIIRFGLPAASDVQLIVYNTLGQEVRTLFDQPMDAGYHTLQFDGAGLPSGVYFYRLRAGTFVETKRLLLIK